MPEYAQAASYLFAVGTLGLHALLVLSVMHRLARGHWFPPVVQSHMYVWGLRYASLFPLAALFLSLWYSEVVGLPVCVLCWLGRTMMYPLAIILPIAAWRNDREIWRYVLPLTGVGALVTGYQHLLQVGLVSGSFCHAFSTGGDCAARYVFEFGYITLPLFGTTVCVVTALLVWVARRR